MSRRARVAPTPAVQYAPGYFCQPVLAWRQLQHSGEPQPEVMAALAKRRAMLAAASKGRAASAERGVGWGDGTIVLPNSPVHRASGRMPGAARVTVQVGG